MYIALGVVIFWVVLGLGVFLVAMRGGAARRRQALHTESKAGRRGLWAVVVLAFAFGLVVPGLVLVVNAEHKASAAVGGVHLNSAQQKGRELFRTPAISAIPSPRRTPSGASARTSTC